MREQMHKGDRMTDDAHRPSFLTEKEAKDYVKARKLYNRRVAWNEKQMTGAGVDIEQARAVGLLPVRCAIALNDIQERRTYECMMSALALGAREGDIDARREQLIKDIETDADIRCPHSEPMGDDEIVKLAYFIHMERMHNLAAQRVGVF